MVLEGAYGLTIWTAPLPIGNRVQVNGYPIFGEGEINASNPPGIIEAKELRIMLREIKHTPIID